MTDQSAEQIYRHSIGTSDDGIVDPGDYIERLAIGSDEEGEDAIRDSTAITANEASTSPRDDQDFKHPLDELPTRSSWQDHRDGLFAGWHEDFAHWTSASAQASTVRRQIDMDLVIRQTLIQNNFPGIADDLVENHVEWCGYVERVTQAQNELPRAVNWLSIQWKEYQLLDVAYGHIYSLIEDGQPRDSEAVRKAVSMLNYLLDRIEFVCDRVDESSGKLEALFELEPAWYVWDDFCNEGSIVESTE